MTQIQRIQEMEACLDASRQAMAHLSRALETYEAVQKAYKKLSDYYGSARWMKDFEDDEAGRLPADLKRGVLSEDAVYDLITEHQALRVRMMKLLTRQMETDVL